MFPIRDHNPSDNTPYVTYTLIAANIALFLLSWPLFSDPRALQAFFFDWALIPNAVANGTHVHGLVTSMFLHAGFLHLAGNVLFLWIFGDNLEEELGHLGYLIFYLASGIAAGLSHVIAAPYSIVPTVGASGAIAGVMGGYILFFPKARVDVIFIFIVFFRIFPIPAWIVLGIWLGIQVINGLGADISAGGVAYWAHAGGFLIGLVFALPLWLQRGGTRYWSRTHGHPDHPEAGYRLRHSRIPRVRRR